MVEAILRTPQREGRGATARPFASQYPQAATAPSHAAQDTRKATALPDAWTQQREVPTDIPPVTQGPWGASSAWLSTEQHARGASTASPPAHLLSLHRRSLTPVLILGGASQDRSQLARAFHRESPRHAGAFVRVDCARDEPAFTAALQEYLLAAGATVGNPIYDSESGTLFLDSIASLAPRTQRLLFELVSRSPGGWAGRVIVGSPEGLDDEVAAGRFHGELFDCLDKLRVPLATAHA